MEELYVLTDDYRAVLEKKDGFVFVHIEVFNWSSAVLKDLKHKFFGLVQHCKAEGYDMLFTYATVERAIKLANMISPVDETGTFGEDNEYFIAAWDLEDERWQLDSVQF